MMDHCCRCPLGRNRAAQLLSTFFLKTGESRQYCDFIYLSGHNLVEKQRHFSSEIRY